MRCIPKGKLAYLLTGEKKIMNVNERLYNMSKEQLINLVKEIKITCESNQENLRFTSIKSMKGVLKFILRLIKGEI